MEKLEGMISEIVFKNEDNVYTIAHLVNENDENVVVGCMPTLAIGESIEVEDAVYQEDLSDMTDLLKQVMDQKTK